MYLVDRPSEDVTEVAGWFMDQWGPDRVEHWLPLIGGMMQHGVLPTTFVAVEGEQLLGTASLVAAGPGELSEYAPWLASVYVPPVGRRRGVTEALIRRVQLEAAILGFNRLYFHTTGAVEPYLALGWRWVSSTIVADERTKVLMLELAAAERAA
jgi:GNAT superfamily N-acetyltransferase